MTFHVKHHDAGLLLFSGTSVSYSSQAIQTSQLVWTVLWQHCWYWTFCHLDLETSLSAPSPSRALGSLAAATQPPTDF